MSNLLLLLACLSDIGNGHRLVCESYGTLTLSERNVNAFTTRQRSFLRALVDTAYARNRRAIFMQHAVSINNGHPTYVVYNYAAGAVKIRFKSTIGLPQLDGPEWKDLMLRASMSEGKIKLDVVETLDPNGVRYTVLPLRSASGIVEEELRRIAGEFRLTKEHWETEESKLVNRIQGLITLTEDPDFLKSH
ncbi:hypothetical protein R3P38DRAFT_3515321 [Favolaschia claudopus]|uniref:Uncharacterized protein n=1 Tax=Favolaschia claudopus TaxID=2862362 RepID=A0AAV9Z028_9AGAR